jgi:hypothetical protein
MRLDQLRVELRPRSPWEAVELGTALVRTHARVVWVSWLLASLPLFVLFNALGWALDLIPWAAVALWWFKPAFDRAPLFVVSRAVFGDAPGVRDTLAATLRWGWRPMLHYLTWRRLGMARSLYLPIDLLEGGPRPAERRRVIGGAVRGVAVLLTLACAHFEMALVLAAMALVALFVPVEFLSESARAAWALLSEQPPRWAQLAFNAVGWLATSVIEPFYVGAGFGLYLNRRTQIEAWDVEIAFRRMRQRLGATLAVVLCACTLACASPGVARADDGARPAMATKLASDAAKAKPAPQRKPTLPKVFGPRLVDGAGFSKAVDQALADPLLSPKETRSFWEPRKRDKRKKAEPPSAIALAIARVIGALGESGLWILLGIGVLMLLWTHRTWRPWLRDLVTSTPPPSAILTEPHADGEALPEDVPAAARRLWSEGRFRRALALLYRASVESMVARTGTVLVPGATEAECLRAARGLRDPAEREAFGRAVRVWQYAAYAERLPATEEFEALLAQLSQRFGWAA